VAAGGGQEREGEGASEEKCVGQKRSASVVQPITPATGKPRIEKGGRSTSKKTLKHKPPPKTLKGPLYTFFTRN
jgi:hypothetical protein